MPNLMHKLQKKPKTHLNSSPSILAYLKRIYPVLREAELIFDAELMLLEYSGPTGDATLSDPKPTTEQALAYGEWLCRMIERDGVNSYTVKLQVDMLGAAYVKEKIRLALEKRKERA